MTKPSFQIRVCQNPSCGLRYPLVLDHPFGERCPLCLGETIPVLDGSIEREPTRDENVYKEKNLHVMLDNIRSAWNVGSIFRTADGFGFKHLYLCGTTPTPDNKAVTKTSLAAEEYVTWSAHKDAFKLASGLKKQGFAIWALEQTDDSESIAMSIDSLKTNQTAVLVVGSEVTGVDPGILGIADRVVHLSMRGQKRSFNVAVAFAVAAQIMQGKF